MTNRPPYCKCAFTDPDGTFVPGEACAIHPDVKPQREARASNLDVLKPLLERLRTDGGRYLLSVGLTREERDAQPEPTFGGKGHVRWLTDEEYAALCSLSSPVETSAPVWKRMRDQVPANGTWIWWDYGKGPMLQRAQDFASEDDGYWIEATPPLRSPEEPTPPHPGPSIAKAFANSPRRIGSGAPRGEAGDRAGPQVSPLPHGFITVAQCASCCVQDFPGARHHSQCACGPGELVRPENGFGEQT